MLRFMNLNKRENKPLSSARESLSRERNYTLFDPIYPSWSCLGGKEGRLKTFENVWRCLKMFEEARKKKRNVKTCFIEIEALSLPLFREKFVKILEEGEGHVGKDSQYTYTI